MAEATSERECVDRHRSYSIDVGLRMKGFQRRRIEEMVAPILAGWSVLDVGCNSGYIVDFLPPTCTVFGVDVSTELVRKASERITAFEAPAERLPFPSQSMDVVVLGEILEHVHDPLRVMLEARRVARRMIVGSTPHEDGKWGPKGSKAPATHRFHVRCFTRPQLARLLEDSGLAEFEIGTVSRGGVPQVYVFSGVLACE